MVALADELKEAASIFSSDPGPAAEEPLRALREKLANNLLCLNDLEISSVLETELGLICKLLIQQGIASIKRRPVEESELQKVVDKLKKNWPGPPSLKLFLTALLYYEIYELDLPVAVKEVPEWLQDFYLEILLMQPSFFKTAGDAERYFAYLSGLVSQGEQDNCLPPAGWTADIQRKFTAQFVCVSSYFNQKNMIEFFRSRANLAQAVFRDMGIGLTRGFPLYQELPARPKVAVLVGGVGIQAETFYWISELCRLQERGVDLHVYYTLENCHPEIIEKVEMIASSITSLVGLTLSQRIQLLRGQKIDLLMYCTNITAAANDVFLLALVRIAPIQVVSMASPVTSGISGVDWFLSSEWNEPFQNCQAHYTEKLFKLPGPLNHFSFDYDTQPATMDVSRTDLGLTEDQVVFFSSANYFKLSGALLHNWLSILKEVENSVLVLMPFNPNWMQQYPRRAFLACLAEISAELGIDYDKRVYIIEPVPCRSDLQQIIALTDIYLDSFPFAGSCSLFDPLSVGVPAIVRSGETARSHHGAVVLRMWQQEDCIAASEEEFIAKAVTLAKDADKLAAKKKQLLKMAETSNPMLDKVSLGERVADALQIIFEERQQTDQNLLNMSVGNLKEKIVEIVKSIPKKSQTFQSLVDLEWVQGLLLPYFQTRADWQNEHRMIDVGACYGQLSLPFLAVGWTADLFEPDPDCNAIARQNIMPFRNKAVLHGTAIACGPEKEVSFYKSSEHGLSGLARNPYEQASRKITVPAQKLSEFWDKGGLAEIDFLKIDAEGFDLDILMGHDFNLFPAKVVMVEAATVFERQDKATMISAISLMENYGYACLVLSYVDDGNFKNRVWKYRLVDCLLDSLPEADEISVNMIFYRQDDRVFLACLARLLMSIS